MLDTARSMPEPNEAGDSGAREAAASVDQTECALLELAGANRDLDSYLDLLMGPIKGAHDASSNVAGAVNHFRALQLAESLRRIEALVRIGGWYFDELHRSRQPGRIGMVRARSFADWLIQRSHQLLRWSGLNLQFLRQAGTGRIVGAPIVCDAGAHHHGCAYGCGVVSHGALSRGVAELIPDYAPDWVAVAEDIEEIARWSQNVFAMPDDLERTITNECSHVRRQIGGGPVIPMLWIREDQGIQETPTHDSAKAANEQRRSERREERAKRNYERAKDAALAGYGVSLRYARRLADDPSFQREATERRERSEVQERLSSLEGKRATAVARATSADPDPESSDVADLVLAELLRRDDHAITGDELRKKELSPRAKTDVSAVLSAVQMLRVRFPARKFATKHTNSRKRGAVPLLRLVADH